MLNYVISMSSEFSKTLKSGKMVKIERMFSKTASTLKIVVFDDFPTLQCASGCESILIWKMLWLAKRPRVAWITEKRGHVCCKISRDWVSLWAFLTGVFTKDTYRQWQAFSCLKFRSGTILMSSQMYFKTSIIKITADFDSNFGPLIKTPSSGTFKLYWN